jgi:hypothetical protein
LALGNAAEYKKLCSDHAVANANKPIGELMKDIFGEEFETNEP